MEIAAPPNAEATAIDKQIPLQQRAEAKVIKTVD